MTLLEWIKANAKEGANVAEAEEMIEKSNPIKNVATKEDALSFIAQNTVFQSALDSETSKRVDNALEKFKSDKLPTMLKEETEKVRAELNPKETEADKRIRELEDKIKKAEKKEAMQNHKAALRAKAKELAEAEKVPYDPMRAEMFSAFGEDAESMLAKDINYIKTTVESQLSGKLKQQFSTATPTGGTVDPATLDQRIADAKKDGDLNTATKLYFEKLNTQAGA